VAPAGGRSPDRPGHARVHGVTDPRIAVDWGHSGGQAALHPLFVDRIEREPVKDQKVYLDRPYYRWRIALNWPAGGEIVFGAWASRRRSWPTRSCPKGSTSRTASEPADRALNPAGACLPPV